MDNRSSRPPVRVARKELALCVSGVLACGAPVFAAAATALPHAQPLTRVADAPATLSALLGMRRSPATGRTRSAANSTLTTNTLIVTSCADDGGFDTLRHAVLIANPGDTIDLSSAACSKITLQAGAIAVDVSDLTIKAAGSGALQIDGNHAGRVFLHNGTGTLTLSDLRVANGTRAADKAYGGCIYSKGSVALNRVVVSGCTALGQIVAGAGGILTLSDLTLRSSTLSGNSAVNEVGTSAVSSAGGAAIAQKLLTMYDSVVSGNTAVAPIGKVYSGGIVSGSLTVKYSTFSANQATSAGDTANPGVGGAATASAPVLIVASTIDHNEADVVGGLLISGGSSGVLIAQTTISSNIGRLAVGGISSAIDMEIDHSTIAFNVGGAQYGGGGGVAISAGNVTVTLQSTILADNSPNDIDGGGVIAGADNLVKIAGANATVPLGTLTLDPNLGPLQFNGGSMRTHGLGAGSPAIDTGNDVLSFPTDERGSTYRRVVGIAADMGAFEVDTDHIFGSAFSNP